MGENNIKRQSKHLDRVPIIINKKCLLDSLSETVADSQAILFLEFQNITDEKGRIVGASAIISAIESEYFEELLIFYSTIMQKNEFIDARELTWQEIKEEKFDKVKLLNTKSKEAD
jgi:hypothetical protein